MSEELKNDYKDSISFYTNQVIQLNKKLDNLRAKKWVPFKGRRLRNLQILIRTTSLNISLFTRLYLEGNSLNAMMNNLFVICK